MANVELPQLGESVEEGVITSWLVEVGDTVEVDQPIVEISTDKVDTEIPSPVAGTVQELRAEVDDTVEVGQVIAVIGEGDAPAGDDEGGDEADQTEDEADQSESPTSRPSPAGLPAGAGARAGHDQLAGRGGAVPAPAAGRVHVGRAGWHLGRGADLPAGAQDAARGRPGHRGRERHGPGRADHP